ncbi:hypothetical protein EHEL_011250 [Encephalitozoon hellem ATCC 50504]|uniref:Uncharacterized protein n=1 Tax=Encephalitozoon hellem TaxID=27973 RepID=A0A9Q9C6R6_ENCHE|nr:uncharacterized protein EHEL_011250 [Encephalitozoon hellem ATCC 50504]AFM97748.1 hypothetical protein EHEL_011250 [Encephalitozoon hellem ATCC 50504]UTX42440.1 hypothetical protein GPU96_01g01440 [Encephalitozoon hellem]|eukprot:XP_003886729.1 hypothetical protein EHEL_011250 [Encephalitozoon hellem ATCC 50504]
MGLLRLFFNALVAHVSGDMASGHGDTSATDGGLAIPTNLNREILYESFISIDSLVFISEMNQFTSEYMEEFVKKTVLVAKELLVENSSAFNQFNNYLDKVDGVGKDLKDALELRNKYFNSDRSTIGKELSAEKYRELRSRTNGRIPKLYYEDKDEEYVQMMKRLMNAKHEDDGIHKAINREMAEFYGEKTKISKTLVLDSRISLSIGGSIFAPGVLVGVVKSLAVPNVSEVINRVVPRLVSPCEDLISKMHLKSSTERRSLVMDFLYGCLERRNGLFKEKIDKAFEERTKILDIYLKGDSKAQEKLRILDKFQEDEINKLISVFKNIRDEDLVLRIDRPVVDAYINLLKSNQKPAKEHLYDLFKK